MKFDYQKFGTSVGGQTTLLGNRTLFTIAADGFDKLVAMAAAGELGKSLKMLWVHKNFVK